MYTRQSGFGSFREILLLILLSLLAVFAVNRFSAVAEQAKVNGAFKFANESKLRLGEFYLLSARFPSSDAEVDSITKGVITAPDYIRDVTIEESVDDFDVVLKVYFKNDEVDNLSNNDQFIYLAGNRSTNQRFELDWTCGARGIDSELLPSSCRG